MSGHLVTAAGYLDLPQSHKLALMKMCDSADDGSRLGFPGLDAIRLWSGTGRSRTLGVLKDLQEWGLIMQVSAGHKGHRAVYKVFPSPGDDAFSLARKRAEDCPGAHLFKGPPGVPSAEEVQARVAAADSEPGGWNGAGAPKGPTSRTLSIGSNPPDPMGSKGPIGGAIGSNLPDPFFKSSSRTRTSSSPTADAAADKETGGQPRPPKPDPNNRPDVTALCDLMADLVTGNGCPRPTITKAWRDDARLLLDKDSRDLEQALALMRWAAADPFWRANIRSVPKFRTQYDQLRMRAGQPAAAPRPTRSDVAVASFIGLAQDRRARHDSQQIDRPPDRPDRPQLPASGGLF